MASSLTPKSTSFLSEEQLRSGAVLAINKPLGWTSFDVVNKIRWVIRKRLGVKKFKVGHAGTLDPLATGVLVLCVGKATKTIESWMATTKAYSGVIRFGATTPSFDLETAIDNTYSIPELTQENISQLIREFTGVLQQRPPRHSAIQIDGQRAYKQARKGEIFELAPRPVEIQDLVLTPHDVDCLAFSLTCSKGTYIRSLARDMGTSLGNGAHLIQLTRTAVGEVQLEDCFEIEDCIAMLERNNTLAS